MTPGSERTAALVLAYRQAEYLGCCLEALAGEVDFIVAVYSDMPFIAYNPLARGLFGGDDGTLEILDRACAARADLHVVRGRWDAEEPMRDAGLARIRQLGAGVCLIVDADEFYPPGALAEVSRQVQGSGDEVLWCRGRHLFRRMDHLVVDGPPRHLPVAFRVRPESRFVSCRVPSGGRRDLPDHLYYWHSGYVQTDARMWEKIHTFGHSHEVVEGWFKEKWLAWTPQTEDLFHKQPARWPRTRRIDPRELPPALHGHRFFAMALQGRTPR